MNRIPLKDFRTSASKEDVRRWYRIKLLVADGLLARRRGALSGVTSEEVLHETLVRIEIGQKGYEPMAEAFGETEDQYMRRCLERTVSSMLAERQKAKRRRKHDENIEREIYQPWRSQAPQQEAGIHLRDSQRELERIARTSKVGAAMKALAADATRFAQLGFTNRDIANENGEPEDTVRKRRARFQELVEAYISTAKEASK